VLFLWSGYRVGHAAYDMLSLLVSRKGKTCKFCCFILEHDQRSRDQLVVALYKNEGVLPVKIKNRVSLGISINGTWRFFPWGK